MKKLLPLIVAFVFALTAGLSAVANASCSCVAWNPINNTCNSWICSLPAGWSQTSCSTTPGADQIIWFAKSGSSQICYVGPTSQALPNLADYGLDNVIFSVRTGSHAHAWYWVNAGYLGTIRDIPPSSWDSVATPVASSLQTAHE